MLDVPVTRQKRLTDELGAPFVDWISIRQDHEQELPLISAGVVWASDDAGNVQWRTVKAKAIEGSYETAVQVRCDGHSVSFSGNVSRFGRADNLFGFSFDQCINIINGIVGGLGLPPFTAGKKFYRHVRTVSGAKLVAAWTGAAITRIDLTTNFETGSLSNARAYMEWLASQQGSARIKVATHGDGETVDWGRGSRALYSKAYLKYFELLRHDGPRECIDHCERVGLVRFEVTFKATWLHNNGCHYLGGLDMSLLRSVFAERQSVMTRAEHSHDDLAELPNHFRRTARDYLAGDDVAGNLSLASFKRHRKALLPYGLDIAVKRNVIEFKPRVRVIEVRPAMVPSWYDFGERIAA
jgi:hypothetical protein